LFSAESTEVVVVAKEVASGKLFDPKAVVVISVGLS